MTTASKVVLVSIDGVRPDGLMQANTPFIDQLIERGRSTMQARTVMPSITFPCHNSMMRSVVPGRHGILDNVWTPMARPVPSVMEVLADKGRACAMFYNWQVLRDLVAPEKLKASFYVADDYNTNGIYDTEVANLATGWLSTHEWNFAFVYLGHTDLVGHTHGWMSPQYLEAIGHADQCVGHIMQHLPDDAWMMIVSDHGGHEFNHGTDMDEDMLIPMVVAPLKGEFPSNSQWLGDDGAEIIDVAPTILALFGETPPQMWTGKSLISALEE